MQTVQSAALDATLERVTASAYKIPTDSPESDGTLEWDATTLVVVELEGGGKQGLGYTYADGATALLIRDMLAKVVTGRKVRDSGAIYAETIAKIRNLGRDGITAMAISAIDVAVWDLRAKLADMPLAVMLGMTRDAVPVYGSGGFTSYSLERLQSQLSGWVDMGIPKVKMKVGRDAAADPKRVAAARDAIGDAQLFVDANGGYVRKQALRLAHVFAQYGVTWFEEPVYHRDLAGLRLMRDHAPPLMEISMGEYGYQGLEFRNLLEAGAVDVLQADATRCGGVTGFLQADALCDAFFMPLSSHCAPSLHLHVACAAKRLRNIEYFHDHVRIEHMLFDGAPTPVDGFLKPDLSRPGIGLEFKRADAQKFAL